MNTKSIVSSIVISVIVVILGFSIFGGKTTERVIERQIRELGSVVGPEVSSPFFGVNDVRIWPAQTSFAQATNTPCALKSPAATSTLIAATVRFDVATSVASIIEMAKANTAYATTTLLGTKYGIAASIKDTVAASTTQGQAGGANIFSPSTFFVVKSMAGATHIMNPTGKCEAVWLEL